MRGDVVEDVTRTARSPTKSDSAGHTTPAPPPVNDLCRVAARRLAPHALAVTVEGDAALADSVLAGVDAFARD